jgi:hypothetical protein
MSYFDYAHRLKTSNGDRPNDDFSSILKSNWDQITAQPHDAIIYNKTVRSNPATTAPSYITWMTRRTAVSQLRITIAGVYRRIFVKLVGMELSFPNAINGWLDLNSLYDGYGTPAVGRNSDGCAMGTAANGKSGEFICTFGTQSSTYAINNAILVRVRLEGTDMLTSIGLEGIVENPDIVW